MTAFLCGGLSSFLEYQIRSLLGNSSGKVNADPFVFCAVAVQPVCAQCESLFSERPNGCLIRQGQRLLSSFFPTDNEIYSS